MPAVPIATLVKLQHTTSHIRNISIVAHVDHGKTTLSDSLISSNGIFSARNAGKIRYMDYTKEEQERGITMKSASITLMHTLQSVQEDFLINLIDSPGHVDFTSEVSSALRVSDGAVVVLDAIEGVCIQTRVVLRQAWEEKVKPVLFINKVDKLITKLNYDAVEAFAHIQKLLSSVNEVTATLALEERFVRMGAMPEGSTSEPVVHPYDFDLDEDNEGEWFSPSKGNVVFGSALGGWAFGIEDFVNVYVEKLGVKADILRKVLWGDFYYEPASKMIYKKKPKKSALPMFVNFILKPIWSVYGALMPLRNEEQIQKIIASLKIDLPARDVRDSNSPGQVAANILSKWLPLAKAVLDMVVRDLPSPDQAQVVRVPHLWPHSALLAGVPTSLSDDGAPARTVQQAHDDLFSAMKTCDVESSDMAAFIAKVFMVPNEQLIGVRRPGEKMAAPTLDPSGFSFIGMLPRMGRIFSGTIKRGQTINVLGPKYYPLKPDKHRTAITVSDLFILMGRAYEPVEEVPAGNVFGIAGLQGLVLKTATLSTHAACASFDQMNNVAAPIVRVAVEPMSSAQIPQLREALKLLNMADPGAEVFIQKSGEHIVAASGELHLKRCLSDLEEIYAKMPLKVSPPIVSFKETITADIARSELYHEGNEEESSSEDSDSDMDEDEGVKERDTDDKKESGEVSTRTMDGSCVFTVNALPLPPNITKFLEENKLRTETILRMVKNATSTEAEEQVAEYYTQLEALFTEAGEPWAACFPRIWAFGPDRSGPNMLLCDVPELYSSPHWSSVLKRGTAKEAETEEPLRTLLDVDGSIVTGFSLATEGGPLCLEPLIGVAFFVSAHVDQAAASAHSAKFGPLSGQVMSAVKQGCRRALARRSQRLVQPLYDCHVQVFGAEHLGKCYGVLSRRRSQILREDFKEGTDIYEIFAYVPVAESFSFAEELFTTTSGAAHGQLAFSHWAVIDEDPNFVPQTEEELLVDGYNENVGTHIARQYIDNVRRRKGLPVKEKRVEGTKQRTLAKKK